MEIKVRRVTDWKEVLDAARGTINKEASTKDTVSDDFKKRILMAEHSPIRCLMFMIELKGVPSWVSQHIARHDAFAGHTVREGAYDTHFVGTQRTDRTGVDRNKMTQDAPVNHRIWLSAADLIQISRKRLCSCASRETRFVWGVVKAEVEKTEPQVAAVMVRECVYRGFCPEMFPACEYARTDTFDKEVKDYRSNVCR